MILNVQRRSARGGGGGCGRDRHAPGGSCRQVPGPFGFKMTATDEAKVARWEFIAANRALRRWKAFPRATRVRFRVLHRRGPARPQPSPPWDGGRVPAPGGAVGGHGCLFSSHSGIRSGHPGAHGPGTSRQKPPGAGRPAEVAHHRVGRSSRRDDQWPCRSQSLARGVHTTGWIAARVLCLGPFPRGLCRSAGSVLLRDCTLEGRSVARFA